MRQEVARTWRLEGTPRSWVPSALAIAFVAGVIAIGLVSADFRWLATSITGALGISIGITIHNSVRAESIAWLAVGVGIALSFALPLAPVAGLAALIASRHTTLKNSSRLGLWPWAAAGVAALGGVVFVLAWADSQQGLFVFGLLPEWAKPGFLFWVVIIGSSALNAACEEVLWRHLLVRRIPGGPGLGLPMLSVGFGLAHINSLPSGWTGVLLTTLFAAAAHGLTRLGNGNLLPPILAHMAIDIALLSAVLG